MLGRRIVPVLLVVRSWYRSCVKLRSFQSPDWGKLKYSLFCLDLEHKEIIRVVLPEAGRGRALQPPPRQGRKSGHMQTKACPLDSSATVWCGCVRPHPYAKIHLQRIHGKRPTVMAEAFAEENLCWWPSFADSCWQTMVCELFKQDYAMLYGEFLWHKALLIDSGVSVSCERFCKYMRT